MNGYDEFAAEMTAAGWPLDEIEEAWQLHLYEESLSEGPAPRAADDPEFESHE